MKIDKLKSSILALFFLASAFMANAQNICEQKLREAQLTYEQGRINEVPEMLRECLENGFTREEKVSAYKLLTLNYLYYNEKAKAEESLKMFLELNPEYKLNEAVDPPEFINLYNSFRTWPVLLIGLKAGANYSFIEVSQTYTLDNNAEQLGEYTPGIGYQVGASFEIPIRKFSINPELYYTSGSYTFEDKLLGFATLSFEETQSAIELPLLFKYNFRQDKRLRPFVGIGGYARYLLSASARVVRTDSIDLENNNREVPELNTDVKNLRESIGYGAMATLGFRLKSKTSRGLWSFEFRWRYTLSEAVDASMRGTDNKLMYGYGHLDNDFRIHDFSLNLGYMIPQYKPKVLKRNRTDD